MYSLARNKVEFLFIEQASQAYCHKKTLKEEKQMEEKQMIVLSKKVFENREKSIFIPFS